MRCNAPASHKYRDYKRVFPTDTTGCFKSEHSQTRTMPVLDSLDKRGNRRVKDRTQCHRSGIEEYAFVCLCILYLYLSVLSSDKHKYTEMYASL